MIPLDKLRSIKQLYTHANCPDGVASALIVKDALPDVTVLFVKYGTDEHRRIVVEPGVLFCDFSPYLPADEPARSNLVQRWRDAGVVVLDHHTRDVVEPYGELGVFGENERLECGAMLAFKHVWLPLHDFQSSDEADYVFNFAELAAVRDTWQKHDPRWREACEQAETIMFWGFDELSQFSEPIRMLRGENPLGRRLFQNKLDAARTAIAESVHFTSAKGTRVLLFQGVSATSDAAELLEATENEVERRLLAGEYAEDAPMLHLKTAVRGELPKGLRTDLVVGFHYRIETPPQPRLQLQFSTRSHTGFDCQALARAHGGNGHRAAAGFTVEVSPEVGGNPYAVFRELLEVWEGAR